MAQQPHENLDVPTPVLVGVIGGILFSFFIVTYLLIIVMDALRA